MITSKKIKLQKNIIAIITLLISGIAQTVTVAANNSLPDNTIVNDKNMTFRDSGYRRI